MYWLAVKGKVAPVLCYFRSYLISYVSAGEIKIRKDNSEREETIKEAVETVEK